MQLSVPIGLSAAFIGVTLLTVYGCYSLADSIKRKQQILFLILGWLLLQAILSLQGVYHQNLDAMPPFIVLFGILPALGFILWLFFAQAPHIHRMSVTSLTYIHTLRIPVELILYGLYLHQAIPERMTFEGKNLDIIAGLTSPIVAFWGVSQRRMNKTLLIGWNIFCLGLLFNIIINALLSAPTPLQKFAFDEPNIGILFFPYSWLPTFIVPVVLFCHLAALRKLWIR